MDGRAEAYLYAAASTGYGVPELLTRSRGGKLLFAPGAAGDYIMAVKPLPAAWSAGGGNLVIPFTITHVEDLTIQASWGIGISGAVAGIVLVIAMAWNLRVPMEKKEFRDLPLP
jgi:hypothetical protein